jgi:hypothetical protein
VAWLGFAAAGALCLARSAWALPLPVAPVTFLLSSAAPQAQARLLLVLGAPAE